VVAPGTVCADAAKGAAAASAHNAVPATRLNLNDVDAVIFYAPSVHTFMELKEKLTCMLRCARKYEVGFIARPGSLQRSNTRARLTDGA
jgi:hypothetical protein